MISHCIGLLDNAVRVTLCCESMLTCVHKVYDAVCRQGLFLRSPAGSLFVRTGGCARGSAARGRAPRMQLSAAVCAFPSLCRNSRTPLAPAPRGAEVGERMTLPSPGSNGL